MDVMNYCNIRRSLYWLVALSVGLGADITAVAQTPAKSTDAVSTPKVEGPAKPLPDLSVDLLELVPTPVDRRRTRVRVRISNVGTINSPATGVLIQCFVTVGEVVRNCRGANPPPRFSVPHLRPGDSRTYEVPLHRFLERGGQPVEYEIKALLDTGLRSTELNRYNNIRQLRLTL